MIFICSRLDAPCDERVHRWLRQGTKKPLPCRCGSYEWSLPNGVVPVAS